MRHNVTTPGGFFVGLGGIAAFCAVAAGVYCIVGGPTASTELEPHKVALGLVAKSSEKEKQKEIDTLLGKAANEYNGGKTPNLNNLDDLRGVVRFREAHKSNVDSMALLTAKSTVEGKNVLQAAMDSVATEMAAKKPVASAVKVDLLAPAADAPVSMPNFQGGGAKTITFPVPVLSVPAAPNEAGKPQNSAGPSSPSAGPSSPSAGPSSPSAHPSSPSAGPSSPSAGPASPSAGPSSPSASLSSPSAGLSSPSAGPASPSAVPAPNRPPLMNSVKPEGLSSLPLGFGVRGLDPALTFGGASALSKTMVKRTSASDSLPTLDALSRERKSGVKPPHSKASRHSLDASENVALIV